MNKCVLMGRITKDLEVRRTSTNKSVLDFSVACNEGKTRDGREIVEFVNVQAWENQADTIAKYFSKGDKIMVEGRIRTASYDGQNGKVYRTYVQLERFEFCGSKKTRDIHVGLDTEPVHTEVPNDTEQNLAKNFGGYTTMNEEYIETDELPFY